MTNSIAVICRDNRDGTYDRLCECAPEDVIEQIELSRIEEPKQIFFAIWKCRYCGELYDSEGECERCNCAENWERITEKDPDYDPSR